RQATGDRRSATTTPRRRPCSATFGWSTTMSGAPPAFAIKRLQQEYPRSGKMANRWLSRSFAALVVLPATQPVGAQFAFEPKKSAWVGQVTELPPPAEKKGSSFADPGGVAIVPSHQNGDSPGPVGSGGSPASSTFPVRWNVWWRNLLGCDQAVPSRPLGDA